MSLYCICVLFSKTIHAENHQHEHSQSQCNMWLDCTKSKVKIKLLSQSWPLSEWIHFYWWSINSKTKTCLHIVRREQKNTKKVDEFPTVAYQLALKMVGTILNILWRSNYGLVWLFNCGVNRFYRSCYEDCPVFVSSYNNQQLAVAT